MGSKRPCVRREPIGNSWGDHPDVPLRLGDAGWSGGVVICGFAVDAKGWAQNFSVDMSGGMFGVFE